MIKECPGSQDRVSPSTPTMDICLGALPFSSLC